MGKVEPKSRVQFYYIKGKTKFQLLNLVHNSPLSTLNLLQPSNPIKCLPSNNAEGILGVETWQFETITRYGILIIVNSGMLWDFLFPLSGYARSVPIWGLCHLMGQTINLVVNLTTSNKIYIPVMSVTALRMFIGNGDLNFE